VWVEIRSLAFDPKRAHLMYNYVTDGLECAAECGFDAVCVNEHYSNGYGLMPSPNLIASSLARRTMDTALCAMSNSLALADPPTRFAEEFAKGPWPPWVAAQDQSIILVKAPSPAWHSTCCATGRGTGRMHDASCRRECRLWRTIQPEASGWYRPDPVVSGVSDQRRRRPFPDAATKRFTALIARHWAQAAGRI
jgi:hypothetical protein